MNDSCFVCLVKSGMKMTWNVYGKDPSGGSMWDKKNEIVEERRVVSIASNGVDDQVGIAFFGEEGESWEVRKM